MLLNPSIVHKAEPLARLVLKNHEATVALGKSLSQALNDDVRTELGMETFTIGLIAHTLTGKSTLTRGIYDGLGSAYTPLQMGMIGSIGEWSTQSLKGGLIRHFDLAVQPDEDDPSSFPQHWRNLGEGLNEPGLEIVEHALKFREDRYILLIKLDRLENGKGVQASLYCADELLSTQAFQAFMREQGLAAGAADPDPPSPKIS